MDFTHFQKREAHRQMRFQRIWLLTYVALFSALLAFFIIMITMVQLEGIPEKRAHQILTQQLYVDLRTEAHRRGLIWLNIENNFPKGVRIYLNPAYFAVPLFSDGAEEVAPRYRAYIRAIGRLLRELNQASFQQRYAYLIQQMASRGYQVRLTLRIEGHTAAPKKDEGVVGRQLVEQSVFRAYHVMQLMRQVSRLPDAYWGVAGYGPWHPLFQMAADPRNHRIELFVQPEMSRLKHATENI